MLSKLITQFQSGVELLLADRTIPISEDVINSALSKLTEGVPALTSLTIDIQDGFFELLAEGRKVLAIKSRTRFEITSCEISANKQIINFRRISSTELSADNMIDRMLISLFKAILSRIFQIEPANYILKGVPGLVVEGDNYSVDLSQTDIAVNVTQKIEYVLKAAGSLMKVKELKCVPKILQVLIGKQ
jgi:hypothetical protein